MTQVGFIFTLILFSLPSLIVHNVQATSSCCTLTCCVADFDPAVLQTLLGLATPSDPRLKSGATSLERPLSSAVQTFQEKQEDWPLKQPLPKTTALLQVSCQFKPGHWIHVLCSGRTRNIAQYIDCFEGDKEGSCGCCCSTVYDQGQKSKTETTPWMPLSLCYTL